MMESGINNKFKGLKMKKIVLFLLVMLSTNLSANYFKNVIDDKLYYFWGACEAHKVHYAKKNISTPPIIQNYNVLLFNSLKSFPTKDLCYFEANSAGTSINILNKLETVSEGSFPVIYEKKNIDKDFYKIDVLIAYDSGQYSFNSVKNKAEKDVSDMNQILINSGLSNIEIKILEIFPIEANENGEFLKNINDIEEEKGKYKDIFSQVKEVGADILVYYRKEYWVPDSNEPTNKNKGFLSSGIGYISGFNSNRKLKLENTNETIALVAMEESRIAKYVFSHEVGHVLGLHHDIITEPNDTGFFPFSRGYGKKDSSNLLDDGYYTIMGYAKNYDSEVLSDNSGMVDQSSPYFSSPEIIKCGISRNRKCGDKINNVPLSDNVSTLKITAPLISGIRHLTGKTLRISTNGDDEIIGTPENDDIDVKSGFDIVYKSSGEDIINFISGDNLFVLNEKSGLSTIEGFKDTDKILLNDINSFTRSRVDNNLVLNYNSSTVVVEDFYKNFTNYKIEIEDGKKYLIPVKFDPQTDTGLHLNNETICLDYLSQDLIVTGTGTLCLEDYVSNLNVSFETGNILLKGNNQLNNVVAKRTVLKPKSSNSGSYTYLPYKISGDLILETPNDNSVYSILNSTIRGNLEIEQGAYLTTSDINENKTHELKVYGKIINNGDFDTFSEIKSLYDAAPLDLYLNDRFLDFEIAVNTTFGSGSKGLDRIKGNIYVKSKYPFRDKNYEDVYSLHSLETFKEDNVIEVSSNQIIDSYKKAETKFQVNSGNRLVLNHYDVGSFSLIKGSQLVVNNFNSDADVINIQGEGSVAFNGSENELNNDLTSEDKTIYGSDYPDLIVTDSTENIVRSGADNDMVYSKGIDKIYLGEGGDSFYNSIEKQSALYVYENEGTETIYTCSFSENSVVTDCRYNFDNSVTQKIVINYNRDESIENYYKENDDLVLEIGSKNKFIFKDAFAENRIQYDIIYQDGSSMDWNQLKTLADIPEENRNVLKDGDYFEIFDESDNGTYYVPEGAIVTFGEYRSGEVVNNGTIITETIKYDLNMSGNGSLEIKNTSGMRNVSFNDGDILLSGYYSGGSNVSAKTIIIDYIHKHPNGINYQYIYGSLTGDVIVRNSLNDSDYSILNNLIIKGSLTIENNVLATSGKYSRYSKSQIMKIYGRFVNNGEFNNIDIIDSSSRKSMVITLYDYIVNSVVIEKASFSDGAFEQIKGSVSIYSTNIYDYDLSDLDILTSFENGVNEINVDSNLTLGNYNGRETTFNVKNGSTLIIKSYTGGDFHIEDGSKVVIESFGRYPQPLDITGNGVLEIKNTGGMNSVNFLNGTVLLSGYSAGGSIKAKTIIVDYLHKHVNDIGYQYIGGVFEGNVIFRNSLNDSDYGILSNLTIRGSLTIEENVFITSREYSRYSKSQTMKIYGKFVNKGEFDNISIIDGSSRKSMVITLYDYIVDDVIVEKASFNGGAFDKIKGSVSIYSSNIYDYDLTNLKELTLFENGTNKIEIDKDFVIANYEGRETTFNIKNNSTLILKSYKGGKFNIEDGSKVVIESFGRYPQPLDITGNGVLEIKNTGGMNSVNFLNGTVLLSGYVASGSVKAKTIIVDYLDKNVNDIGYQHIGGIFEGNVIFRNSLNDSDYGVLSNLTIRGSLTIEENVFITSREYSRYSQSQTMKIYGKFVNKGEFDNISIIDGSSRKSMVITLYDYIVDDVIVEKASFNGGAFEQIKGSVSIYSTNIYDYDLDNLDIFTSFENGINDINVDSNLTLGNYNGRETTFNVKNGSTLRIKSYVGGKFNIEDGAKVVIENFGRYPQSLNISGSGVLEIKNTYNMRDINFFNGVVLLSGYNAGGNVKAKTIVADYIHKLEGRDYQYIHGNLEGNVIFRNSLNDSDYIAVAGLIIKGALTIEENTLVTSRAYSRYSSSQTIKVYGKFLNNGDFNNVESIANQSRSSLNLIFYDYVVNDIVIEKASFNNGAFKNIKGSLNIYSENIYDFNLSEVSILKSFNNGTDSITIDKDYTVGSYSGHSQTMVVKSGSTLRFKEYIAGDLIIENGAKVIIDSFGRYARDLDVLGGGILEIRNSSGINNIKFYGGKVIFSGYIAGVRSGVHAKDIVFNKIYGEENHQIIRSETITGNVIIKSNSSIDYIYMGSRTLKVYGYLTMESDVVLSSGTSSTYYLEVHGLLNNNGLLTDKILVRDQSSGRLSIRLYDNIDKNILANLNELGNYDISGYIYLNGTNIAD